MADRATTLSGRFQKVTFGSTSAKILGAGTYTVTGATRKTADASEFGVDVDIFEFASADGGTITLADVSYDPTVGAQQDYLQYALENGIKLDSLTSALRFWINTTSFLAVGTSGYILLTKAGEVRADRNGLAKTSFEGQVSGAFMWIRGE